MSSIGVRASVPKPPTKSQPNKETLPLHTPYTRFAGRLCNTAESLITRYIDPQVRPPRSNPTVQLADNFAPVPSETPPTRCPRIEGNIPECLWGGIYIRNGPNPLYKPVGGYHYFDGHGMLHAVKFTDDGTPYYTCRYTETNRYKQERAAGYPLFPNPLGDIEGPSGLARILLLRVRMALGIVNTQQGAGTANAGIVFHNGTLLAMSEDDMPYAVHVHADGDLETTGRYTFPGDSTLSSMTAHPKLDHHTGELLSYSYNILSKPYLRYFSVSREGVKSPDVTVPLPEPVLLHDFAVTENHVILPESQIVFRPGELLRHGKSPIVCDELKLTQFAVLPRNSSSTDDIKWFEVPGFTALHIVNAWEEDSKIVMVASQMSPVTKVFDDPASVRQILCRVHLDMQTGEVQKTRVSNEVLDMGQLNQRFTGRKTRFAYFSVYGPWPKFSGVAKVDLEASSSEHTHEPGLSEEALEEDASIVGWRKFGNGRFGSEPFFVSRTDSDRPEDEDDGFLLCFVHDEVTQVSELLVMDARSPTLNTVASVRLPSRVPYGFHGLFINKESLATQKSLRVNL